MKIVYIADDGKKFDNEIECYEYEEGIKHWSLTNIDFFDKKGNPFRIDKNRIYEDSTYNNSEKIIVHNENELKDLLWLANACGWCEFYDWIDKPGTWIRESVDRSEGKWILQ